MILGAAGGLGGAALAACAADPRFEQVVAISRRRPAALPAGPVTWLAADLMDEAALARAAETVAGLGEPTRVLVAAGRLHGPGLAPEKSWRALDGAALQALYADNAVGPALAAKHLLPRLPRDRASVFAVLSARVGSIGDNRLGGWHGYRMAKAALNMLVHTLAIELARSHPLAACVALHPGTTATDLSAPFVRPAAAATPEQAAARLLALMDRLGPEDSGGFFAPDGAALPW